MFSQVFAQTMSAKKSETTAGVQVSQSDMQLILRCREGDLEAFEQIYRRYERTIFRHAVYLLGIREDADDVKQETFLRAYRTLGAFRNDCDLQTWLFKICSNLCYDLLRRKQRRPQISLDSETIVRTLAGDEERNNPVLMAESAHTLQTLLKILQAMPPPQRQVVTLYLIEGFDYPQIARILSCAHGSAKMRVLRAMEQYRERVASVLKESDLNASDVKRIKGGKDHV